METMLGLFAFFLGGGAVLLGYALGLRAACGKKGKADQKNAARNVACAESMSAESERERKELEDEQRAFRLLTGYNADVAYGRESF